MTGGGVWLESQFLARTQAGSSSGFTGSWMTASTMLEAVPVPTPTVSVPSTKDTAKKREAASSSKAHKPTGPRVTELMTKAVSASKEHKGLSFTTLKKALTAGGYDVEKNSRCIKLDIKSLVSKGSPVQTEGTGTSSSFKLNKKLGETKEKAPKKKLAAKPKKPAAKKPKKAAAVKKSPKKVKKLAAAATKKVAKSPKKAKKSGSLKKTAKSLAKAKAVKPKAGKPKAAILKAAKAKMAMPRKMTERNESLLI
ncbi:histone H1-like [Cinclus cinclus]|uniref:histone H1-like n=1 Tax=Cinclus cinclus TaxID=127875 RepID=UPI002E142CE3